MKIFFKIILLLSPAIFISCINIDKDNKGLTTSIPLDKLESKLSNNFPINQKMKLGTLRLSNPSLTGKEKNSEKLDVGVAFKFSNFLIPKGINGAVNLSSGIRYNSSDSNLYLKNPMVKELKLQNFSLSKHLTPNIRKVIGQIVSEVISKYPIYNLKKSISFASNFVRSIKVKDKNILVSFGI